MAAELGLRPWEFSRYTFREFRALVEANVRREARADDDRAKAVAHLMLATGNYGRGTTVSELMRGYLGREPGTVPGQEAESDLPPKAESDVLWMKQLVLMHGGAVRRRESA